jgi:metallopeptidase MepB
MLENWCWTPSQLKSLSCHYSTLSPAYLATWREQNPGQAAPAAELPDGLMASLVKTKHVNEALFTLRQLHFGIFDMAVHEPASQAALAATDVSVLFNTLRAEITQLDGPETTGQGMDWGHGEATFGHLMGAFAADHLPHPFPFPPSPSPPPIRTR